MKKPTSHFRWIILGLIFFITILNYMDRASISYTVDILMQKFHLNDTEIGWILGAFSIGYFITTFLGGICVDHYGTRKTLLTAAILWSIALSLTGFAGGFTMLFMSRILLGFAEGPNFPALSRTVSDWLNVNERSRALSSALVAVPVGLAIGGPLISELIILCSWRGMFFILSAVTLIWVPIWWYFFRDHPEQSTYVNKTELAHIHENTKNTPLPKTSKKLWLFLFTDKTLLVNYFAFFVFGYYLFFFMGWLPIYLTKTYQLDLHKIGLFTCLPWILGAIFMWATGILSDTIYIKTKSLRASRSHIIWISQFLSALCILPIIYTHNITLCIVYISLAVGFIMSANGAYYAVIIDMAKARAGTAMGIADMFFALSGFLSPIITGWLTETTHQFDAAFLLLAILGFTSVLLTILFHKPQ